MSFDKKTCDNGVAGGEMNLTKHCMKAESLRYIFVGLRSLAQCVARMPAQHLEGQ